MFLDVTEASCWGFLCRNVGVLQIFVEFVLMQILAGGGLTTELPEPMSQQPDFILPPLSIDIYTACRSGR